MRKWRSDDERQAVRDRKRSRPDVAAVLVAAAWAAVAALSSGGRAEARLFYDVDLSERARHVARIAVRIDQPAQVADADGEMRFVMSRSSPGRYALHEFAKNVSEVEAVDQRGWRLPVRRVTPHEWAVDVSQGPRLVTFRYTLYADLCDGTYSAIDRSHAHLNGPATWIWVRGLEEEAHDVRFELPQRWRVATQLPPRSDGRAYRATTLQELLDSPIEVSTHEVHSFIARDPAGGRGQEIVVALHHRDEREQVNRYLEGVRAIVAESAHVFGQLPAFDHGRYTFLADYLPWCDGDGMEHRNSTVLTSSGSLASNLSGRLGTVAHEFVHAWNVERLRPADLEPFDFERANMSEMLWFAEGFTSYYGGLILHRAGITDLDRYADVLTRTVNAVSNTPARRTASPVAVSRQAPFVDAATANDPNQRDNTFLSYYTWGAGVGLALDLSLRSRFERSLDQFLQLVWSRHGEVDRPYEIADLERLLATFTGDEVWAEDFFARHVWDGNPPPYDQLLDLFGFVVRRQQADEVWLGVRLEDKDPERDGAGGLSGLGEQPGIGLVSNPLVGSPAYRAGLGRGDRIVALDGVEVTSTAALRRALDSRGVGGRVQLKVLGRGERVEVSVVLAGDPRLEVVSWEEAGRAPTEAVLDRRSSWLAPRRQVAAP